MLKIIGLITTLLFTQNLQSQKLYVWCQKNQLPSIRQNFSTEKEIDLVLFDNRIMTKKSKTECSSESIINNLTNFIKDTYPSIKFNLLSSENYYKNPNENSITIKIIISAYHAAFGANVKIGIGIGKINSAFIWGIIPEGKWNAVTGYSIKIFDYRNDEEFINSTEIGKIASLPNTGGYRTAKNILNTTYINANQDLFLFIDESLLAINKHNK